VRDLDPQIDAIADELIDQVARRPEADLVREVAEPLSLRVILRIIGVADEHCASFRKWADNIMADLAGGLSADEVARAEASRVEFVKFLKETIEARRARPGDDLISRLIAANEAERLTPREVTAFCVLLLVAGFEPVVNGIGNTLDALLSHPNARELVLAERTFYPHLIEEALRWDTPVTAFFRDTLAEVQVGEERIPARAKVMIHFGAANRDPHRFPFPDEFDILRERKEHMAFGLGIHHCLGSHLARAELNSLLPRLLMRFPAMKRKEDVRRYANVLFRGVRQLPVKLAR
jgi:cytochrome P450